MPYPVKVHEIRSSLPWATRENTGEHRASMSAFFCSARRFGSARALMKTVLFACIQNAGRSQMAAAWFNLFG